MSGERESIVGSLSLHNFPISWAAFALLPLCSTCFCPPAFSQTLESERGANITPSPEADRCAYVDANGVLHNARNGKDRRTSVESGNWTVATVSLQNTWHLLDKNPGRKACFYSPDKKKRIDIDEKEITLIFDGKRIATEFGELPNDELGWAPDSKRFFVTWTTGGEEGEWRVGVYEVQDDSLRAIGPPDGVGAKARSDFEKRVRQRPIESDLDNKHDRHIWRDADYCEPANIVGSKWLDSGKELLLSVMIVNVPARCRYGGSFEVYRVRVDDGAVLQRYSPERARRLFGKNYFPLNAK